MDFKLILLILGIGLSSCADIKKTAEDVADTTENVWKGKRAFGVTFMKYRPYCGGARPTEEQASGTTEPMANQVFYIYEGERPASTTQMTKVTTDIEGRFRIDLTAGIYSVIRADKALPFDEFIALKKIENEFYSYSDDECFKTWRNTPDFTAELKKGHVDEIVTIKEKCFTGDNPCMEYTGPQPP